jgi:hypothetical protein
VAPIYDWQLVPIARFADSEHTAAFSLFGRPEDLGDEKAASDVGGNGGVILKYHEAFKDTLVGLRLFQLDILIGFEDATDLPGYRGYYMLGRGETVPDHAANVLAFSNLDAVCLSFAPSGRNSAFHSYVIHDAKSKVTISSRGAYLHLTGQPRYHTFHFGRSRSDPPLPNWRLNRWLSRNIPAVRNINPAVWDTATNVMRYAAFFRYAKAANEPCSADHRTRPWADARSKPSARWRHRRTPSNTRCQRECVVARRASPLPAAPRPRPRTRYHDAGWSPSVPALHL